MRVLMQMDAGDFGVPGGHRRQMDKTAEYLRALGVEADISSDVQADLTEYDLVHCFGTAGAEPIVLNAHHQGKLIALSPIYWSIDFFLNYPKIEGAAAARRNDWSQRVRMAAAILAQGHQARRRHAKFWTDHARIGFICRSADIVLPNADAEGEDVIRECGVDPNRVHFVPNAVDLPDSSVTPDAFVKEHGLTDFVLCVGRVEPRKNHLRLIQAMRGSGIPLVIVDPIHPYHAAYRERCRRAMDGRMLYLQKLSDSLLRSAYAAAKVHVLPSFYETTGLVSLEAALYGCNVVVNDQAHTHQYFGEEAWYCDPYDVSSIRDSIEQALEAPVQSSLRERILRQYTWEHTAQATLDAYEKLLSSRRTFVRTS